MKTILILTDFSEDSFRASQYGCEIAKLLQADQIILYHAYQTIVSITDIPQSSVENNLVIQEDSMDLLAMQHERLKPFIGSDIRVTLLANDGFLPEGINELCYEEGVVLIVMGVSGKTGIERTVMGSTTSRMLENSDFPVLIVPPQAVIGSGVKSVVLTSALKDMEEVPMLRLFSFLDAFKPSLAVVNVETPSEHENHSPEIKEAMAKLQNRLAKYQPAFYYIEGDDVVESILAFADDHKASMIIGVPEKHGMLSFHKSVSKKLAYNSKIPFLALPALQKPNPVIMTP
ncbi:MAG: universal stress protein [Bacteroidetes bacterium]|nr:universal stress protein [Bacteroidota bacterium]